MKLIDADAAIKAVEKSMYENPHENTIHRSMHDHEHRHFLTILMGLPSAQPEWAQTVERWYNKALCLPYIRNPLAWALYQTWKEYDNG